MYFLNSTHAKMMQAWTKLERVVNNFLFAISAEPQSDLGAVEYSQVQTLSQEYKRAARTQENSEQIQAWRQARNAIEESSLNHGDKPDARS